MTPAPLGAAVVDRHLRHLCTGRISGDPRNGRFEVAGPCGSYFQGGPDPAHDEFSARSSLASGVVRRKVGKRLACRSTVTNPVVWRSRP